MDAVSYGMAAYVLLTLLGLRFLIKKYRNLRPQVEELDIEKVQLWLAEGATLWDVRSERERETGTIKGSVLQEYGEVTGNHDPEKKIVCYCTSGIRAQAMAENLKKAGVKSTAYFKGGYHHLKEHSAFEVVIPD